MVLTVTVKHKIPLINKTVVWGSATLQLSEVLADPGYWGERRSLRLQGPKIGGSQATLELQLFLSMERLQGSLSVLCATWNVGNAQPPPPDQLQDWLRGTAENRHHLVVVGAQECNYIRDARRSVIAKRAAAATLHELVNANSVPAPTVLQNAPGALPAMAAPAEEDNTGDGDAAHTRPHTTGLQASISDIACHAREPPPNSDWGRRHSSMIRKMPKHALGVLREQVDSAHAWERHMAAALGSKYWLVQSKHMFQTRILLFARMDVVPSISNLSSSFEATGIGRIGVNKGGVCITLKVDDTHLCFVNSHLAAHQSKTAARNADVAEIVDQLRVLGGAKGSDAITGYHHVAWMGDLNYRLEYGQQAITQADSPSHEDFVALCADISAGRLQPLQELDQLKREQAAGSVFVGFFEGAIDFPPTFKVAKGDSAFNYDPKRSPAWCDRVLLKSVLPHKGGSYDDYFTAPQVCSSDHKPVGALLSLPLATHTVTKGGGCGKTPLKLYMASVNVADMDSWRQLSRLVAAAQQGDRRRLPRLQLVVTGSCLGAGRHQHLMRVNMEAVGAAIAAAAVEGSPADLCSTDVLGANLLVREENMPLLPGAVEDLSDDWLLLRLMLVEGLKSKTLARTVVPLQPAVLEYKARTFKPVAVPLQLECGSAAAGRLLVQLQLISSHSARQGMYEAVRRMRVLAMARSQTSSGTAALGQLSQTASSPSSRLPWLGRISKHLQAAYG
eukprot:gene10857-11011_t